MQCTKTLIKSYHSVNWSDPIPSGEVSKWKKNTTTEMACSNMHLFRQLLQLASSRPYGPLLARSGYPGQEASFYNIPMVMICAPVNALLLCCKWF